MKFLELIPFGTNIDFISKFKYFIILSIASLIFTVGGMIKIGLNYGIDFTGGTIMHVKFPDGESAEEVRRLVEASGEADASVVAVGIGAAEHAKAQEYLITARTHVEKGQNLAQRVQTKLPAGKKMEVMSLDVVGPKVGAELRLAALRSLFYTIVLIMIYIWFRFDFIFAPGATVAMVHDLLMTTGFYLATGREFTITAVAALLTIAGYSVNDTIVVYDRVREILKKGGPAQPMRTVINSAVNQTLSRTVLTSGITLISILPLIFFTKGEIQSFAIAMCFGIFVGTYSTIYIASPLTIYVAKYTESRKKGGSMAKKPVTA